jgi:heme/copper-type cytochrome/quinol oxidase subunit 2
VIARAALTVHSTSISIVGIALTVVAALVLLVWWARTWRKGRNRRPRAHMRPVE